MLLVKIIGIIIGAVVVVVVCELLWPTEDEVLDEYERVNRGW
jgi:hypothetical protein